MIGNPHWFADELVRRMAKERNERADTMTRGCCADYPGYRYECGVIDGLRLAGEVAGEILKELDRA